MTITPTEIEGLFLLSPIIRNDERGSFFKNYHLDTFENQKLPTHWAEEYFSVSQKNVLRGMHFQVPPSDHYKMVTCLTGTVLDVVVDIRKASPSYGKVYSTELNSNNRSILIIPHGCAHGFLSLEDNSLMFYKVSTVYSPEHDKGIAWDSIDFDWTIENPILSERDNMHPPLKDFKSPF